ncbi:MAG: hypothetical protein QOF58_3989 [Pseudonocardiales bacterium]|jgi:hypothetical protein|nr:hypothetical protein [Pseudonocardiales bacterium]
MTTADLALSSLSDNEGTRTTSLPRLKPQGAQPSEIYSLFEDILGPQITGLFDCMEWAEDEIHAAQLRYPWQADRIWHVGFMLLRPTNERLKFELVYRAHCRELLDRVAADQDTRPGTAAEICCALRDISLATPIRSSAAGLYMRMWIAAGLPEIPEVTEGSRNHEALEKSRIDDNEAFSRSKLAVADRQVGVIKCSGLHHGDEVNCVYAPAPQLALGI